ncbi:hypothetical protein HPP92_001854 [Vanilla planifolia]|uniref:Uncharacterized protein n=1 Tax=Vanilla planifolia TaxID=51239 RepID=A0A835SDM4_VANPL|nr:hypothetical protein HPP92_001854 [Vanilla planifolia]
MEEKTVAKKYSRTPKRAITRRRERSSVRLTGLIRGRLQLKGKVFLLPFSLPSKKETASSHILFVVFIQALMFSLSIVFAKRITFLLQISSGFLKTWAMFYFIFVVLEPLQIPFSDCRQQGLKHNPLGRN